MAASPAPYDQANASAAELPSVAGGPSSGIHPRRRLLAALTRGGAYAFDCGSGSRAGSGLIFARIVFSIWTRGDSEDHPEIWDRIWQLEEEIATAAPVSLAGAAVKLRRLADPDIGIEAGPTDEDPGSIRQVLDVVETLLGEADAEQFLAAEREIAEANRLAQAAVDDEELHPIHRRHDAAAELIDFSAPRSLVAAAVKLRRLLCDNSALGARQVVCPRPLARIPA